jgi:Restriction endonuclease
MTEDSRNLELLVQRIQRQLAPTAEVLHNVHLPGRTSKVDRQIDVLVRQKIGQYEMLIVLDCKDHARPIDVTGVEAFIGLVKDVGAHRGALICPRGFSAAAKDMARAHGIDLYSPVDTEPHKWQMRVTVPMVCDFRSAAIGFGVTTTVPKAFLLPMNFWNLLMAHEEGSQKQLGIPMPFALDRWNRGGFTIEPGRHDLIPLFDQKTVLIDNGYGELIPMELTVSIWVEQQFFFGNLPIKKLSGFKDALSGAVITNAFTTGIINPNDVYDNWQRIESIDAAPQKPLMTLRGLIGYDAKGE